jgi:drug/metabolite transporter (DMT)-like permease
MFCNFSSLARRPDDATAISFVSPLTVAMAAIFLKERVRIYRWSAGHRRISACWPRRPHLEVGRGAAETMAAVGALLGLAGAFFSAGSTIQTRALTSSETTSAIVFYFSLIARSSGSAPGRSAGSRRPGPN